MSFQKTNTDVTTGGSRSFSPYLIAFFIQNYRREIVTVAIFLKSAINCIEFYYSISLIWGAVKKRHALKNMADEFS
ncbi:hypothetical protein Phum_PHUM481360 [Pediculus humanus corporis]|uniref:Uncharacterized protein n=1 Tax=Pediculus humanus subsp. corporis TaxID=121224 RepID=E0VWD0_PEDHC|nr:uncharacterized protein Phum_PHUM481360 [Pediculus humanus corporis]EEB17715.1 hypothetical protein Phum_PHUM481360 [Pediculus humanus corporis]